MKTIVYFVRHAQSDNGHKEEMTRPLTPKGMEDRMLALAYLKDKQVKAVYSSPYLRAVTTVQPLAEHLGLEVVPVDGFRERDTGDITGIDNFAVRQWADKAFAAPGGESIGRVQARVAEALQPLLEKHTGEAFAVGCHGTMLGATVNHFDDSLDYEAFGPYRSLMPWIVEMTFEQGVCTHVNMVDPFNI